MSIPIDFPRNYLFCSVFFVVTVLYVVARLVQVTLKKEMFNLNGFSSD